MNRERGTRVKKDQRKTDKPKRALAHQDWGSQVNTASYPFSPPPFHPLPDYPIQGFRV